MPSTFNINYLSSALPTSVSFNLGAGFATADGDSFFDVQITDEAQAGFLGGLTLDGYCIDGELDINQDTTPQNGITSTVYTAKVYSSYDITAMDAGDASGANGIVDYIDNPGNLDLVNWLINQDFSPSDFGNPSFDLFNFVQLAIWQLIDGKIPANRQAFYNTYREQIDTMVDLAIQHGEGFVPTEFGQKVAVVLVPDADGAEPVTATAQTIIVSVEISRLGDRVWEDLDADGIQDVGETGIAGATVNLLADINGDSVIDNSEVIATTTTDANGNYHFDVIAGDYKVQFETPANFSNGSPADQGNNDTADSDAGTNGTSQTITLAPGEDNPTIDAGFYNLASLGDFVFIDNNQDGMQDGGDSAAVGVTVNLLQNGVVIATTTTGADGSYLFTDLIPGDYQVQFEAPTGFVFTTANVGDDATDSDADANGFTQTVTLQSGENNLTLDAGLIELASLGDTVFHDRNANGIQDTGEEGIAGATVTLIGDVDGDGDIDTLTTTTDSNGNYRFGDLAPGDYTVEFSTPAGFTEASPINVGGDDAVDSDGTSVTTNLEPGENDPTLDSGFYNLASLGDFVFIDNNQDGMQDGGDSAAVGVTVNLLQNGVVIATTTTGADGSYLFTDLIPGDYQVQFEAPTGFVFTTANVGDDATDSDADANGFTQMVTLQSGENNLTLDAGLIELTPGINIEKFVNGIDVTDLSSLPKIAAGAAVTFTYEVTNTGNVAFAKADVVVTDDNGTANDASDDFTATLVAASDVGGDGILSAGETWLFTSITEAAQDLSVKTLSNDVRFYLTGNSFTTGHYGNTRTFSAEGVTINASAFSYNSHHGWASAYLGAYGGGLGVTNRYEGGSGHRVDNGGSLDFIVLEFDETVVVDKAFLDYVGNDSDVSIWVGDRQGDINALNSNILNSFTQQDNFTSHGGDRWADFTDLTGDTLIIAAYIHGSNDSFKLKTLDVKVAGETLIGDYINTATVTAGGVSDSDQSGYTNPERIDPIHYEAENMHLCNYKVTRINNFDVIQLTSHTGYAKQIFDGLTGTYDIIVGYFDENDGQTQASVQINGNLKATWVWNQNLGSSYVDDHNAAQYVLNDVHLGTGDIISLSANLSNGEYGRFDYLKIVAADTISAAESGVQDELLVL